MCPLNSASCIRSCFPGVRDQISWSLVHPLNLPPRAAIIDAIQPQGYGLASQVMPSLLAGLEDCDLRGVYGLAASDQRRQRR